MLCTGAAAIAETLAVTPPSMSADDNRMLLTILPFIGFFLEKGMGEMQRRTLLNVFATSGETDRLNRRIQRCLSRKPALSRAPATRRKASVALFLRFAGTRFWGGRCFERAVI